MKGTMNNDVFSSTSISILLYSLSVAYAHYLQKLGLGYLLRPKGYVIMIG
jgi:hypothetical protein